MKRHECNIICNGLLLSEKLIEIMLSSKNFKVLSISIDNRKNTIRKLANVNEKTVSIDELYKQEEMDLKKEATKAKRSNKSFDKNKTKKTTKKVSKKS